VQWSLQVSGCMLLGFPGHAVILPVTELAVLRLRNEKGGPNNAVHAPSYRHARSRQSTQFTAEPKSPPAGQRKCMPSGRSEARLHQYSARGTVVPEPVSFTSSVTDVGRLRSLVNQPNHWVRRLTKRSQFTDRKPLTGFVVAPDFLPILTERKCEMAPCQQRIR
jgi:hypothetical protein